MKIFKDEHDTKRVIFNVDARLARRLERAKTKAKRHARKLNIDAVVDEALARYLEEAERLLAQLEQTQEESVGDPIVMGAQQPAGDMAQTTDLQIRQPSVPKAR